MKTEKKCHLRLMKKKELLFQTSYSSTTADLRIAQNLLPPPISTGARGVAFISHEIQEVLAAMAAGKSNEEIKTLIEMQLLKRQELLGGI